MWRTTSTSAPTASSIEDIDKDGANELIVGVRQSDRSTTLREVLVISIVGEFAGFHSWNYEFEYRQDFGGRTLQRDNR